MPLNATAYPHVMNALNGPTAGAAYLVFFSSIVDGQMWCPDCRRVESLVKATFEGEDAPRAVIQWVGDKPTWRSPTHPARLQWNVQNVPTILRLEGGKETARLVEDEILDEGKRKAFLA